MIEKAKILEAWIMVEHLSEGDIHIRDRSLRMLNDLPNGDFYTLFQREIGKKKFRPKQKGGLALYLDIFDFQEVVSILREQYGLKPTHEEIRTGHKFSLALYFDKDLKFLEDMTFFTESAYIRYFKKVPQGDEFREFEADLKQQLVQDFEGTAESPEKFNAAVQKQLEQHGIPIKSCRFQMLSNVETEGTNLHSFFIGDLEKAKETDTANLRAYLHGNQAQRVNLDSKKGSAHFNPRAFEAILQPDNYPLGRFPSKTAFALSLMQQAAVNLSIGADTQTIRSVNGPPGTGKTTLLKDIFAQLAVQQAYDIAQLQERRLQGTEETVYYERASIGVLPAQITENSIVVASSNNGAVQNIVNELPLCQGIDGDLLEELKEADYFREISNAKVSTEWKEDEKGRKREQLVYEPCQGEELFWGMFSLEGGRSDNMTNILTHIKHVYKYLEEEYLPDEDIYESFLKQYEAVRAQRAQAQAAANSIRTGQSCLRELEQARAAYQKGLAERENTLAEASRRLEGALRECAQRQSQLRLRLAEASGKREAVRKNLRAVELCLEEYRAEKPGFLASKKTRDDYRNRLDSLTDQLLKLQNEEAECVRQEGELRGAIAQCQQAQDFSAAEQSGLQRDFNAWKSAQERKIAVLEQKVRDCEKTGGSAAPLDMEQDYDDLQLSNPWFGESYRIAQSKLFLAALRVRKQFLYENRRNLRAVPLIWNQQEKFLERRLVIETAWNWINLTIPVISSTFASFSGMCRNLGPETLGHLFIDEAGQALPQAAVGAVFRSRHVMVVGDPSQIKPVLTLDSNTLRMLSEHFGVTEKYLSASASTQTLVDAASQYGFYRRQDQSEDSWIGIPLWVHRRCQYPMFTISNVISYDGFMVQGMKKNGKTGWYDVGGKANGKYVKEQGEFLARKIQELMKKDPRIGDPNEKDVIYVITPFSNVADQLVDTLSQIHFIRRDKKTKKPTNVGTVHTFQGKEAPIVFFVLGADKQSSGAARWAVSEPNMMNVAATRAKEEFYIVGDRSLYLSLGCDVASETERIIRQYKKKYPELVDDTVPEAPAPQKPDQEAPVQEAPAPKPPVQEAESQPQTPPAQIAPAVPAEAQPQRVTGEVRYVGKGTASCYAYVSGDDGKEYSINEIIYSRTERAGEVIRKGRRISFVPTAGQRKLFATDVKPEG